MTGSTSLHDLYDASYGRLVIQLFALCGDVAEAEDAVQEAFVKAIGQGRAFDRVQNPEAWLRTVAINHQRNNWSRKPAPTKRSPHRVSRRSLRDSSTTGASSPPSLPLVEEGRRARLETPQPTKRSPHRVSRRSLRDLLNHRGIVAALPPSRWLRRAVRPVSKPRNRHSGHLTGFRDGRYATSSTTGASSPPSLPLVEEGRRARLETPQPTQRSPHRVSRRSLRDLLNHRGIVAALPPAG